MRIFSIGASDKRMDRPFSDQWYAPFRHAPFSLRFALGGEVFGNDAPVPRFVQAFGRARQVADEVFAPSERLLGIVAAGLDTAHDIFAPADDGFAALAEAGFNRPCLGEWTGALFPGDAEEDHVPARWRAFDLGGDLAARDVLLWCSIAYEMAIAPKAPVLAYLADPERGILLHVYDDRGMDVTSVRRDPLLPVYHGRTEWLLDHDRPRMAEAFGDAEGDLR